METETYLSKIISKNSFSKDAPEIAALQKEKEKVERILLAAFDGKPVIRYAGSYKKETMVKSSYDLDIVCYFKSDDDSGGDNLEDIFNNVKDALSDDYYVDPKRSALRLRTKEDKIDFHVDVVPGRFTDGSEGDAFLHQSMGNKKHLKTNLDIHIKNIRDSKQVQTIKLAKIWRNTYAIDIKTFVLELLVIRVLGDLKDKDGLEKCIKTFFEKLKSGMAGITVEDPANSGNDLSQLFDDSLKASLSAAANKALDLIKNDKWEDLFGPVEDLQRNYISEAFKTGNVPPRTQAMPKLWRDL